MLVRIKCDGLYLAALKISAAGIVKGSAWACEECNAIQFATITAPIILRAVRQSSPRLKNAEIIE